MSRRKAVDVLPCWMMEAFRSSYPCDLERWCRMRDMLLAILSLSLLQCGSPSDPPSNGSDGADGGGVSTAFSPTDRNQPTSFGGRGMRMRRPLTRSTILAPSARSAP